MVADDWRDSSLVEGKLCMDVSVWVRNREDILKVCFSFFD